MTLETAIAGSHNHDSTTETVTLARPSGASDNDVKARRRELSRREISLGREVGLEPTDQPWELWAATVDFEPLQDDTITDAGGGVWSILSVQSAFNPAAPSSALLYRCICRKQVS